MSVSATTFLDSAVDLVEIGGADVPLERRDVRLVGVV